ncbi:DMT family transporter [Rhodobacter lacus]|uniref:DMT family transporter n=1 Tax=Rhodobacter lacus TaxID=1641972 RepID=A0ABW5A5H3_9RHOB
MNDNTRGILFMVLAMAVLIGSDMVVKRLAEGMPLFEVICLRHIVMTLCLGAMAWRERGFARRLGGGARALVGVRTLGEVGIVMFYMLALTLMPMGTATALFQLQPLAVTLAAAVFLSQPIGPRRIAVIAVGFSGVLLIVPPGTGEAGQGAFGPGALFVLLAVVCVCLRDISTRALGPGVPAVVLAFLASAALLVVSFVAMQIRGGWVPVSPAQLGGIGLGAALLMAGYLAMVHAMRTGDIAVIAPFRYVSLVFGLLGGFVLFGEVPRPAMLLGGAIIVSSGIYTFLRERQLQRR